VLPKRIQSRWSAPLLATASLIVAAALAAPVAAQGGPPGNNGTVKIDRLEFDEHPNNQPHVGCVFEVDFYGFDAGDLWADVAFELHAPTGGGVLLTDTVFIGQDDNAGGGSEAGWDASAEYDLSAALAPFAAHPNQGYHVKLTVHADGSQGADTKQKVFWVDGCGGTEPNTPPTEPPGCGLPGSDPDACPGGVDPGAGGPRGGTAAGNPPVVSLPDTATSAGQPSLMFLAGLSLVSASATLAVVRVRSRRSRD
jgi:hypothetical protein